jgi:triphosphoribosyl-dephospho-CoA synthase
MSRQPAIEAAFRAACVDELAAPKPGNVHAYAAGHRMTHVDFLRSAALAAPPLCREGVPLGARILDAVVATRSGLGQNTNLGIVLLCAPLAMAAEAAKTDLRTPLRDVLASSDIGDADAVFRAIALAAPGGLGDTPRHDVRHPATVPLSVAMGEAAERDSIARQWVTVFADVFRAATGELAASRARWSDPVWATLAVYLHFLSAFPDSHVVRRHGPATAERVRAAAQAMRVRMQGASDPASLLAELLSMDSTLKASGVNPGTSADLTVATLFADRLADVLRAPGASG